jgi:hypothetical protein
MVQVVTPRQELRLENLKPERPLAVTVTVTGPARVTTSGLEYQAFPGHGHGFSPRPGFGVTVTTHWQLSSKAPSQAWTRNTLITVNWNHPAAASAARARPD